MKNATALVLVGKNSDPAALREIFQASGDLSIHLSILVLGLLPPVPVYSSGVGMYGTFAVPSDWQELVEQNRRELSKAADAFSAMAAAEGVEADIRPLSSERRNLQDSLVRRSLSVDIVIPAEDLRADRELFEAALQTAIFNSSAGVLLNGASTSSSIAPKRVFVAWNYGAQAGRAVRAALPILREAEEVTLVIFDPVMTEFGDGENPGSDVARWLTHHGCRITVKQFPSNGMEIGKAIKARAKECDADLIVMGAYEHSRMRETIFGGTTRQMIEQTDIPVLFAH